MECREFCAACCIVLSISSPIPGMPEGKPRGVPCIHLTEDLKCALWGSPDRPSVCSNYKPELLFCGENREQAFRILESLYD